jgi:hypothetical protein
MANTRITVNGQQYDSPEAMPPDVRRMYEEAMRAWGASRAGGSGGGTQVFTGQVDPLGSGLVVNRIVTVNDRTYGSVDELPPEVRKVYEDALAGTSPQTTHPTSLHVSVNVSGPSIRADPMRPAWCRSSPTWSPGFGPSPYPWRSSSPWR